MFGRLKLIQTFETLQCFQAYFLSFVSLRIKQSQNDQSMNRNQSAIDNRFVIFSPFKQKCLKFTDQLLKLEICWFSWFHMLVSKQPFLGFGLLVGQCADKLTFKHVNLSLFIVMVIFLCFIYNLYIFVKYLGFYRPNS